MQMVFLTLLGFVRQTQVETEMQPAHSSPHASPSTSDTTAVFSTEENSQTVSAAALWDNAVSPHKRETASEPREKPPAELDLASIALQLLKEVNGIFLSFLHDAGLQRRASSACARASCGLVIENVLRDMATHTTFFVAPAGDAASASPAAEASTSALLFSPSSPDEASIPAAATPECIRPTS